MPEKAPEFTPEQKFSELVSKAETIQETGSLTNAFNAGKEGNREDFAKLITKAKTPEEVRDLTAAFSYGQEKASTSTRKEITPPELTAGPSVGMEKSQELKTMEPELTGFLDGLIIEAGEEEKKLRQESNDKHAATWDFRAKRLAELKEQLKEGRILKENNLPDVLRRINAELEREGGNEFTLIRTMWEAKEISRGTYDILRELTYKPRLLERLFQEFGIVAKKEEKAAKKKEEIKTPLQKARERFVRAEIAGTASKEAMTERHDAKTAYTAEVNKLQKELMGQAAEEVEQMLKEPAGMPWETKALKARARHFEKEKGLDPQAAWKEALWEAKWKEMVRETVIAETRLRYDLKTKLETEAKGPGFAQKALATIRKVGEWYKKQPLTAKLLLAAGLYAGGALAAPASATGIALVTGYVTGRTAQRILGGAATFVGLEAFIGKLQEKRLTKRELRKLGDELSDRLEQEQGKLNEALFRLEGDVKRARLWRVGGALAGAALMAGGFYFAQKLGIFGTTGGKSIVHTKIPPEVPRPGAKMPEIVLPQMAEPSGAGPSLQYEGPPPPGIGVTPETSTAPGLEGVDKIGPTPGAPRLMEEAPTAEEISRLEVVKKGEGLWKVARRHLVERLRERFGEENPLDRVEITNLEGNVVKEAIANPEKFGLPADFDPDHIEVGQKIDFSVIDDARLEELMDRAANMEAATRHLIDQHNSLIDTWVAENPGEALTTDQVEEILKSTGTVSETTPSAPVSVATELAGISSGEVATLKSIGFGADFYRDFVRGLTVEQLLKEIPTPNEAWESYSANKFANLPRANLVENFSKYVELAKYIRGLRGDIGGMAKLTIGGFLERYGR